MKNSITSLAFILSIIFCSSVFAQDAKVVKLSQTDGEFNKKELTLKPGNYIFEVKNKDVDKPVGLVIAPATNGGMAGEHIKEAYLTQTVSKGEKSQSQVVQLKEGTYKYFCPLNPTPEYTIVVKE